MTTTDELAAIRARWQAATPGRWVVAPDGVADGVFATDGTLTASSETLPDAIAIAAAPTDIATLLAALDAAEAEREVLREKVDAANERARLLLKMKNVWLDRYLALAKQAQEEVNQ